MEQILLRAALDDYRERRKREQPDETIIHQGAGKVLRDEGARKLADTPMLTGDSWYDEMEMAETDESKPLLKV